ncbi:MAG: propionyl-CoA synthetase [SAR324 cluster bacterium]|uniref:Propionyl-CoA synthetase n=1 Tax=SAR324 cluster bacterium TaxID=2024889 RepID=A0A2A4T5J4_9DELT|nr:MAG: propionyl-CoA synthetase [SAR324 cluster bacterium]
MSYLEEYNNSIENPTDFWAKQAENIDWYKKPETILSKDDQGNYRWYSGGTLNTCHLALDYHVENGRGDQVALYYDSPVTNTKKQYTYTQLRNEVAKVAGALADMGVVKGDTVVIYMPMIPEAAMAMLACARLGAIHSVVFGGFAPAELAIRIDDAKPKVLISATCGVEVKKIIDYKPLLDRAIELSRHKPSKVLIYERPEQSCEMIEGRDIDWKTAVSQAAPADCVPVAATDPLYILYTSGTTGTPKGVLRDNGGHAVALKYSMKSLYNCDPGDVYWAASDIGWVVGHSYIVYAPLLAGCSTVFFEGKPIMTPDAGAFWRVMEEYKVNVFFTAPTAFRAIKKEDPEAKLMKNYDLSSLRAIFQAGERLDPPTYHWLKSISGLPVIDHWWQTETGWAIVGNMTGLDSLPCKVGSSSLPIPGYNVQVVDEEGEEVPPNTSGNIVIKLPLPPGTLPTLWNDDKRFKESYLSEFPGYFSTSDGGYIDEDGYVFIMGRTDDVINVAGHRLSTGEMEELIGAHEAVAECAVVGIEDSLKGQIPVGFVILKNGVTITEEALQAELALLIRQEIGAIGCFKIALVVDRLPKTRSGKILRKTIRKITDEGDAPVPSTIDDPDSLSEIKNALAKRKIGKAFQD